MSKQNGRFPPPEEWEEDHDDGYYVLCPDCCESMPQSLADNPKEHSPDCEYIEQVMKDNSRGEYEKR